MHTNFTAFARSGLPLADSWTADATLCDGGYFLARGKRVVAEDNKSLRAQLADGRVMWIDDAGQVFGSLRETWADASYEVCLPRPAWMETTPPTTAPPRVPETKAMSKKDAALKLRELRAAHPDAAYTVWAGLTNVTSEIDVWAAEWL